MLELEAHRRGDIVCPEKLMIQLSKAAVFVIKKVPRNHFSNVLLMKNSSSECSKSWANEIRELLSCINGKEMENGINGNNFVFALGCIPQIPSRFR
jgi:hypothetical protein